MAIECLGNSESMAHALVAVWNAKHRADTGNETTFPHSDITSLASGEYRNPTSTPYLVSTTTPTTLATVRTKCQGIYRVVSTHFGDAYAHVAADTANVITAGLLAGDADQTAVNSFLNEAKDSCNAHATESGVHYTDDSATAQITAPDATDAASSYVLADAVESFINEHLQRAAGSLMIKLL